MLNGLARDFIVIEFFSMGGYGVYVWSSYAITAAVLIGNACRLKKQLKCTIKGLEK